MKTVRSSQTQRIAHWISKKFEDISNSSDWYAGFDTSWGIESCEKIFAWFDTSNNYVANRTKVCTKSMFVPVLIEKK